MRVKKEICLRTKKLSPVPVPNQDHTPVDTVGKTTSKQSICAIFFGTRAIFIRAVPRIFCSVNGLLGLQMHIDIVHWLLFGNWNHIRTPPRGWQLLFRKHHVYHLGNETAWHLGTTLGQRLFRGAQRNISVKSFCSDGRSPKNFERFRQRSPRLFEVFRKTIKFP